MGIERIGGGLGVVPPVLPGVDGPTGPAASGGASLGGVGGTSSARAAGSSPAAASSPVSATPLGMLERGEVSLSEYLDLRVEEAVAHLAPVVDGERLERIREAVRAELSQDPALIELVRRATGVADYGADAG